jgi:hypothetical protein
LDHPVLPGDTALKTAFYMIDHLSLGDKPLTRSRALYKLIAAGEIKLAGNKKLKIYGTLRCASGKRMKTEHRVFFKNEEEAIADDYRPCGNCLAAEYKIWKKELWNYLNTIKQPISSPTAARLYIMAK